MAMSNAVCGPASNPDRCTQEDTTLLLPALHLLLACSLPAHSSSEDVIEALEMFCVLARLRLAAPASCKFACFFRSCMGKIPVRSGLPAQPRSRSQRCLIRAGLWIDP